MYLRTTSPRDLEFVGFMCFYMFFIILIPFPIHTSCTVFIIKNMNTGLELGTSVPGYPRQFFEYPVLNT